VELYVYSSTTPSWRGDQLKKNTDNFTFNFTPSTARVKRMDISQGKGEGKVVPVLPLTERRAMKAYWESEGTALPIV
jgi:hypothetical protein